MKEKLWTTLRLFLLVAVVAFLASVQAKAAEYDVVKRYKLLEDKFYTYEMLNPYGHDFIIDTAVYLNKNLQTMIKDGKAVSKFEGTTAQKITEGTNFLDKYKNTEQTVRVKFQLGIPLPTLNFGVFKLVPDLRAGVGVGMNLGIRTQTYSFAQIVDLLGSDVPANIKNAATLCPEPAPGADIVQNIITNAGIGSCPAMTAAERTAAQSFTNLYFRPTTNEFPALHSYAKGQGRGGLNVNYFIAENWFGNVNLYMNGRMDMRAIATADSLARNGKIDGFGGEKNTTVDVATDLKFGYKNGNLASFVSAEEVKVSRMSDNEDKGVKLIYGDDPLYRLHSEYTYKFIGFDLKPFAGLHNRVGYDLSAGLYGGGDIGFYVWNDRLGIRMRGMVDTEHFTVSPQLKLWLMHLDYMLKLPVTSNVDGVKPSAIHAINFRIFI
jgi:hypothetical protein